jgi:pimeloyl-ACP methyl ester carboxylesterase
MRNLIARGASAPATRFGSGNPIAHPYSIAIDDVWLIDDIVHNQSVDLNAGRLGDVHSWEDSGRDVLNFIQHVLPTTDVTAPTPWDVGWSDSAPPRRKVIGIGHSYGGASMMHAAHARPDLFDALFLVDPMGSPLYFPKYMWYYRQVEGFLLAQYCLKRRDVWPSAAAARELLRNSAFFQPWDEEQFDIYMTHSIIPTDPAKPDGQVTLATPPWCETIVFTEPDAGGRAWDRLPEIPIPVGFCMAGDSVSTRGDPVTHEMVWRAPQSRNERILDVGHLITQEQPHKVADSLWRFLCTLTAGEWGVQDIKVPSKL